MAHSLDGIEPLQGDAAHAMLDADLAAHEVEEDEQPERASERPCPVLGKRTIARVAPGLAARLHQRAGFLVGDRYLPLQALAHVPPHLWIVVARS